MSHEQHPYQRNLQHRTDHFSACMQYCFHLHLSFNIYRIDTIPHFFLFVKPLPQIFLKRRVWAQSPFSKFRRLFILSRSLLCSRSASISYSISCSRSNVLRTNGIMVVSLCRFTKFVYLITQTRKPLKKHIVRFFDSSPSNNFPGTNKSGFPASSLTRKCALLHFPYPASIFTLFATFPPFICLRFLYIFLLISAHQMKDILCVFQFFIRSKFYSNIRPIQCRFIPLRTAK